MKTNLLDHLFPLEYDFFKMLADQAGKNHEGIQTLYAWALSGAAQDDHALADRIREADDLRMHMEACLIQAFSTPVDRGDIYSISVVMDKVIDYAGSTLASMQAFGVKADETIIFMLGQLQAGAGLFAEAVGQLGLRPETAGRTIPAIRRTHQEIEQHYRDGIAALFAAGDPMTALKCREVYHHIKDASANLDEATDLLHRIVVRLS